MIGQGEHADTLRAVGRFLELVGASQLVVEDQDDQVAVIWRGSAGRDERRFSRSDIEALRAPRLGCSAAPGPAGPRLA
jgi:hypothetical protein